jgi:hypothetical protein
MRGILQIPIIPLLLELRSVEFSVIAEKFDVSKKTISAIKNNRTWQEVIL